MTSILFVPGCWLTQSFYQPFLKGLTGAGYYVHYAALPSLNPPDPSGADCKTDAEAVAKNLKYLVEDKGQDVIVMMHSYGGMPGPAAAVGLSKAERKEQGKQGGVIGLVCIGAFLVPEGITCADLLGGNLPPCILLDKPSPGVSTIDDPIGMFADDVDSALVEDIEKHLRPHSMLAARSPQPHPAWADAAFKGRLAFIVLTEDQAIPKEGQYGMMAATGQQWIVKEMVCSHCAPFLNRTEETIRLVKKINEEFIQN